MKHAFLHGLVYAIELPIMVLIVIVFCLFALAHWIDDEWIDHGP